MMSRDFDQFPPVILTVDDDSAVRAVARITLENAGYTVFQADSGLSALNLLEETGLPDMAIVDINMPEMGGVAFCREILDYSDLPVLMLTAVQETETVVKVLTQIAEDYMVKPFRAPELLARIQRIWQRLGCLPFPSGRVMPIHKALQVDFVGQTVFVAGQPTALTRLESRLLYILLRQSGQVLAPLFLSRRLWPQEIPSEERVRVAVHRLRQKIEPEDGSLTFIVTERGDGYRFLI
jgi:DNA-binding response OmpR family regulator